MKKTYVWKSPLPETPDDSVWKEVCEWSKRLAKLVAKGRYQERDWQDQLSSAAAIAVWQAWRRYRLLPIDEWKKAMNTVMANAMAAVIEKEKLWAGRLHGPKTDLDSCNCVPKHRVADDDLTNYVSSDGVLADDSTGSEEMGRVETRITLTMIHDVAPRILTSSELRVMALVMAFPNLSSAELSLRLGDMSPESVRVHKCNAIRKLRAFLGDI